MKINAEIDRLTAERDQALAGIAAAFAMQDAGYRINTPTDAQETLDKLLAQSREDAIREAADIVNKNRDISGWVSHDAILALLTDGGRDE